MGLIATVALVGVNFYTINSLRSISDQSKSSIASLTSRISTLESSTEKLNALEASVASIITTSSEEDERITETEEISEELNSDLVDLEERLTSAEASITTLNTKSENLDVTLLTICNRIDFLSDAEVDPTQQYHCCFNPDLQKMICGSQFAIELGAVEITPGEAGQCMATDAACL